MSSNDSRYSRDDTLEEAWAKYKINHPEVLASWREQNGRWPLDHPNDDGSEVPQP